MSPERVSLVFTDDVRMLLLNTAYLGHDYPTDVLSFPLEVSKGTILEGEVYVNLDQARRQAAEYRVSERLEIRRLVVHGLLHLAGYQDGTLRQRRAMTAREDRYLGLINS